MKIRDLMTTDVITISPEGSIKDAASRMVQAGVSGLVVTDESEAVIGIVSEADFVETEANRDAKPRAGLLRWLTRTSPPRLAGTKVAHIMTSPVTTIDPEDSYVAAASLMDTKGVKRLPVVSDGVLVGIVSRADIVRSFARSDAEIHDEIVKELMPHILWIEPGRVRVTVEDGTVFLRGELATRADAQLLEFMTQKLRGVVSVQAKLTWEFDPEDHKDPGVLPSPFISFSRR